jgi:thioredoxin 1
LKAAAIGGGGRRAELMQKEAGMADDATTVLDDASFDGAVASGVTLVDFYADWCPPCRALSPTIDALAERFAGKATVAKVNVDQAGATAQKFGVQSIPTLVLLVDGEERERFVGVRSQDELAEVIEGALQPTG